MRWDFLLLSCSICFVLWANQYWLLYKGWWATAPKPVFVWLSKTSYNVHVSFFFFAIPLIYYLVSRSIRTNAKGFYGLLSKRFDFRPYLVLLIISVPFIFWASFKPEFQKLYPRYLPSTAESYWSISPWITVLVYQLSYALQFLTLELFYRGFMVFSVGRYLKQGAVWPMVSVYCFLHFTKPMPEALGAVFGGVLLGIIAYHSRSIWGGVLVHLGIAILMEIFAYLAIFVW
ncbi:CPBP family intramembrane glutamic endopeptidase [Reinekea sp. G2M2-21]|uniref:CPBP family intramembrane glutamic endopeptidase n=1 Tax=Reinekea sp. G2M2-21 TaxID=2788942 RepID=UPI0018AA3E5C|nr:CPBP family intramembrane glutamic endopeptidase [Reinekea sp. G2M2-21]